MDLNDQYLQSSSLNCPTTTDKPDCVAVPWIQVQMIRITKRLQMLIGIQAVRQHCYIYICKYRINNTPNDQQYYR